MIKKKVEKSAISKGDKVRVIGEEGTIIQAGPAQSVVRFVDKRERCYPNNWYERIENGN